MAKIPPNLSLGQGREEGKLEGAASQKYPICIKIIGVNKTGN